MSTGASSSSDFKHHARCNQKTASNRRGAAKGGFPRREAFALETRGEDMTKIYDGLKGHNAWLCGMTGLALVSTAMPARAQTSGPPLPPDSGETQPATAQDDGTAGGAIADIVVTAQRRSENVQSSAVAISALSSGTLAS